MPGRTVLTRPVRAPGRASGMPQQEIGRGRRTLPVIQHLFDREILVSAVRPALALALAGLTAVAVSANAGGMSGLALTDVSGDANGLNGQGLVTGTPDAATGPASYAGLDFTKVTLANLGKTAKTCTGFTLTMEFAGPVDTKDPAIYRLIGKTSTNDGIFQIYLNDGPAAGGATEVRYGAGEADDTIALTNPAKVDGNKIVITVTKADMKSFGDKPGDLITAITMDTRVSSGVSFVPQVDTLDASDKTFKMCG